MHDGHQSHVTVRCHHDGTKVLGVEGVSYKNGGGTVRCTNDSDGSSILQIKEEACQKQGEENTKLRCGTKEHEPRFFQQGAKVDHSTNADEKQQGKQLVGHACFKQGRNGAYGIALRDGTGQRQIDQNGTKAHG